MATHLIGLMGLKRSGKDTVAQILTEEYGFTRLAFADTLKDVAYAANPLVAVPPHEAGIAFGMGSTAHRDQYIRLAHLVDLVGWEAAKELGDVRVFLQSLGVAVRDNVGVTSWIDPVINASAYIPGPVVITDVRFPNEGDTVRRQRGSLVRVIKEGQVNADTHDSETLMATYPAQFTVSAFPGDLATLRREVEFLMQAMGVRRVGLEVQVG